MYGFQPTNTVYNVQQMLVGAFEFTDAAHDSCVARRVKKVGQPHCSNGFNYS